MFFDKNSEFDPLYTTHDLYKKNHELNKTRKEILLLNENELYDYVEKIRINLLEQIENKESPTIPSRTRSKIIDDLMKLSDKKLTKNFIHKEGNDFFIREKFWF